MSLRRETFTISEDTELSYMTNLSDPTARVLLFLHFWGGSSKTFSRVFDILLDNGHGEDDYHNSDAHCPQVVALDFRGWGKSTGPLSGACSKATSTSSSSPSSDSSDAGDGSDSSSASESSQYYNYSISRLASDVETLMQYLHLRDVVLVGHSMGAKVAQMVAGDCCSYLQQQQQQQQQQRHRLIRGLVLLAPAPATPLRLPAAMRHQQIRAYESWGAAELVTRDVLLSDRHSVSDTRQKSQSQVRAGSDPSRSDEGSDAAATVGGGIDVEALVNDMLRGSAAARAAWPAYAMEEDVSPWAEAIDVPVLVCAGEEDRVEPVARVRKEVCGLVPRARMVTIAGAGHLLPVEEPARVSSLIVGFLKELDS
ncbi:Alpha/Beta hydrolase protein [Apiospora saccharicola]